MDVPKIIIIATDEPQWLYKNDKGKFGAYRPDLPKITKGEKLQPFYMYSITNQAIKKGDWYLDYTSNEIYICKQAKCINKRNIFKIVGSTDKTLNLSSINEHFLTIYCDTNGNMNAYG
jgi:proteasome assembly chaperone (PAC2) family protein